jgi:adenylate kinase family enzyme
MRVVVVGASGSGKSTFARRLAAAIGAPHFELDAINWQAGWRDLNTHDPEEFARRVESAAAADAWVTDGNYSKVRQLLWPRATGFVWLDYARPVIMRRVLWRSFTRAAGGKELWPGTGNKENFARWLDKEHPIRWAWDTWARNRARYAETFAQPEFSQVPVHRLRHPREAAPLIVRLAAEALPI